jgi:hypothetical protein
MGEIVAD